jgi:thioredoxin-dependent peroxiredoxin
MAILPAGAIAPDFSARTADGAEIRLSQLRGRFVLVFFYPKDSTPGCTAEARGLNESYADLDACGADVIGVSSQDDQSHEQFRAQHDLKFALAADTDHGIARAYGVGRTLGILPLAARQSFLVAPDGSIAHVWARVNPGQHAADVLALVSRLAAAQAPAD